MTAVSGPSAARDAALWGRVQRRVGTAAGVRRVAVGAGVTSVAVTFGTPESDAAYDVLLAPSWDTRAWCTVASRTKTGCTLSFSTAPAGAEVCTLQIVRADA